MIIEELKKKSYIRYLQIIYFGESSNTSLILIYLLEMELIKIFNSSDENYLREIKYQWLIEEFKKNSSEFFLVRNLKKFKNISEEHLIKYIDSHKRIRINSEKIIDFNIFDKISKKLNTLITSSYRAKIFQSNRTFIYFYYVYSLRQKKFVNEDLFHKYLNKFENIKFDKLEYTFLKIFKKNFDFNITKLRFLFYFIIKLMFKK